MSKKAIITGVAGQDGAYLSRLLLEKGYEVTGWARRNASKDGLKYLGVEKHINIVDLDICDPQHVSNSIRYFKPDEIYNLAAQSHVGLSFENAMQTCSVNYGGYLNILLSARFIVPDCKIYQAGTSEMFGYSADVIATEKTPFSPMSPYAISKVAAYWAGVNARYEAEQFACNGILFNHESPLRGADFVTRKICDYIKGDDFSDPLRLGNLNSVRDWGHASDYVRAMYLMMQENIPGDYVIATGQAVSVRSFLSLAFDEAGYDLSFHGSGMDECGFADGKKVVEINDLYFRPNDLPFLKGSPDKAKRELGWKPEVDLIGLIREMLI